MKKCWPACCTLFCHCGFAQNGRGGALENIVGNITVSNTMPLVEQPGTTPWSRSAEGLRQSSDRTCFLRCRWTSC